MSTYVNPGLTLYSGGSSKSVGSLCMGSGGATKLKTTTAGQLLYRLVAWAEARGAQSRNAAILEGMSIWDARRVR